VGDHARLTAWWDRAVTEMLRVGSAELCAEANEIPGATLLVERGVGHEFVRRSWSTVIPAVLQVDGD
jgi:hypothetical protein